ncbi:MAG: TIGR02452 family protein [Spirochaetaceae bacterium]|jgi:uncharacterized protein (TIGR02452 family)|nr:TIGR02452 family protein [Spirochaetaceae bacterium]
MEKNPVLWLKKFNAVSMDRNRVRELRAEVFQETVDIVNAGAYQVGGAAVVIRNDSVQADTEYFTAPPKLPKLSVNRTARYAVVKADCLEIAELLVRAGHIPGVLNMASGRNPGGGVKNGANAQEESLFRRTNLFKSLYQFVDYAEEYGTARSADSYPLDRKRGGIYSGGITVFRASEQNGYALLKKPFQASFISVPAINRPELEEINGRYFLVKPLIEVAKEKMRSVLRIAGKYGHETLVLSAFGCGAFANPPNHIALLFKEVFEESEFKNRFGLTVFAITDDQNKGNVLPFLEVFDKMET